jgi:4-amino-4-deoxy-L-arabinose transferase-like glycosyltransferase
MNKEEYLKRFEGNLPGEDKKTKAEKALDLALDIRKFEIELYWKRATYFWTFIGAALAGYALVYAKAENKDSWLLLVFSCLGFLFSISWYLVNRGSKFWQNNWERHVDLLEDEVIGPLYKTIAHSVGGNNPLTAPAEYSVSKINQILSLFISSFWGLLIIKSLLPLSCTLNIDYFKVIDHYRNCSIMLIYFRLIWQQRNENKNIKQGGKY